MSGSLRTSLGVTIVPGSSVEIRRIDRAERGALDALVDTYLAELGAHRDRPDGPTDAASYHYLPLYWEEAGRHPFFVFADGACVGFVLIRAVEAESIIEMSDFYIRPEARRDGVGRAALAEVWRRFPGVWRLQVHPRNAAAAAFWPRCIEEFASSRSEPEVVFERDGRRFQYTFEIPGA